MFDRNMLENETDEDIVSHLYMSEGYYFNPKILKRHQVSIHYSLMGAWDGWTKFFIGGSVRGVDGGRWGEWMTCHYFCKWMVVVADYSLHHHSPFSPHHTISKPQSFFKNSVWDWLCGSSHPLPQIISSFNLICIIWQILNQFTEIN